MLRKDCNSKPKCMASYFQKLQTALNKGCSAQNQPILLSITSSGCWVHMSLSPPHPLQSTSTTDMIWSFILPSPSWIVPTPWRGVRQSWGNSRTIALCLWCVGVVLWPITLTQSPRQAWSACLMPRDYWTGSLKPRYLTSFPGHHSLVSVSSLYSLATFPV